MIITIYKGEFPMDLTVVKERSWNTGNVQLFAYDPHGRIYCAITANPLYERYGNDTFCLNRYDPIAAEAVEAFYEKAKPYLTALGMKRSGPYHYTRYSMSYDLWESIDWLNVSNVLQA